MSETANEELLRSYMRDVWDAGDPTAIERYVDPSFRRHLSPTLPPLGVSEQIARLQGLRRSFPDIQLHLEDVVAVGDLVTFRSTMRATHRGEFMGLPATGKHVAVGLVDVWRVANGRVAEQWGGPDMFDLLRQLGATFGLPR